MSQPTYLLSLWFRWKSMRLPWRRKWLVGHDLHGHTFWEFKDPLNPNRPRRIVRYPRSVHPGDISLTPAWIQWLRQTRADAPSIEEQRFEVQRQSNMRQLAARADERWRQQQSFLDAPQDTRQTGPQMVPRDNAGYGQGQTETASKEGVRNLAASEEEMEGKMKGEDVDKGRFKGETKEKPNPWAAADRRAPSEGWQPQAWQPGNAQRR